LSVTAPSGAATSIYVDVAVGERKVLEVPPLTFKSTDATPPPLASPPAVRTTRPNPMYYVAIGVALLGTGTALVTGSLAVSATSTAGDGCIAERAWCRDAESRDAVDSARTFAWISTGALVAAAVGTILVLVTPARRDTRRAASASTPGLTF
jgi:hypothetical protein